MTRNQDLNVIHVANASAFAASVSGRVVPGDSLIFDFIYFLHPVCPHCKLQHCIQSQPCQRRYKSKLIALNIGGTILLESVRRMSSGTACLHSLRTAFESGAGSPR